MLALETGCYPDPGTDAAAARRHLVYGPASDDEEGDTEEPQPMVHGRQFKRARDEDGNHDSDGAARIPWVAVPQVINAVRVLKELGTGEGLLFAAVVLALKAAYLHTQHPEWRIAVTMTANETIAGAIAEFFDLHPAAEAFSAALCFHADRMEAALGLRGMDGTHAKDHLTS